MNQDLLPARPKAVSDAVNMLWGSVALSIVGMILNFTDPSGALPANNRAAAIMTPTMLRTMSVIGGGITILFWWWILSKISGGRNWARILFFVFLVIGLAGAPFTIPMLADLSVIRIAIYVVNLMLQIVAGAMLVAGPGARWFRDVKAFRMEQRRGPVSSA